MTTASKHTSRRRRSAAWGVLLSFVVVSGISGACSSPTEASDQSPSTTVHDMSSMDMGSTTASGDGAGTAGSVRKVECAQHMPGDLLKAEQAMVIFDSQHVCLGYVTVLEGTEVTWHNTDPVEHQVTIVDDNDKKVTAFEVASDGASTYTIDDAGLYRFKVSAIETFVGTIEVQKP